MVVLHAKQLFDVVSAEQICGAGGALQTPPASQFTLSGCAEILPAVAVVCLRALFGHCSLVTEAAAPELTTQQRCTPCAAQQPASSRHHPPSAAT